MHAQSNRTAVDINQLNMQEARDLRRWYKDMVEQAAPQKINKRSEDVITWASIGDRKWCQRL